MEPNPTDEPATDYGLSDLYAAAALAAVGVPFDRIDRGPNGRAVFVFHYPERRCAATLQAFYGGHLTVAAITYADRIKAMKSALHAPVAR